jgi:DNA-binding transcriptional LysR family regulator
MMDRLLRMEYFLAVAQHGSFSAAANHLGLAPSATIRAVASLEKSLDTQLIRRTTRRLSLTEEGIAYATRCRAILADLREADAAAREAAKELSGEIRITAPIMLGRMHVAPLVSQFLLQHPKLTVDLQLSDRAIDLVEHSFDLAVRVGTLADSSMVAAQVGSVRRVLCATPSYWARGGTPRTIDELAAHRCVQFDGFAPNSDWRFVTQGKTRNLRPQVVLATNQLDAALQATLEGLGCSIFFSYQVAALLKQGALKSALERFAPPPVPVHVISPTGRMAANRVRAMKAWLVPLLKKRLLSR